MLIYVVTNIIKNRQFMICIVRYVLKLMENESYHRFESQISCIGRFKIPNPSIHSKSECYDSLIRSKSEKKLEENI